MDLAEASDAVPCGRGGVGLRRRFSALSACRMALSRACSSFFMASTCGSVAAHVFTGVGQTRKVRKPNSGRLTCINDDDDILRRLNAFITHLSKKPIPVRVMNLNQPPSSYGMLTVSRMTAAARTESAQAFFARLHSASNRETARGRHPTPCICQNAPRWVLC